MPAFGKMWIAGEDVEGGGELFTARNAATGKKLEPAFREASGEQVEAAIASASLCSTAFAATDPARRASLLDAIADSIAATGEELIDTAMAETGLPRPRLEGERARTVGQFRMFAESLREGEFLRVRLDAARPDRLPAPKPDLRLQMLALGPVTVFGASNFPLAFSVGGGDTASALAAGCPVIVKGHPAHPGTSEIMARAVGQGIAAAKFEAGIFSMLQSAGPEIGMALVSDPRIKAVGFTGSAAAGKALVTAASARREPIPVYAEMSSINPVLLLPSRLSAGAEEIAEGFVASLTLGSGQFCTNPGLVLVINNSDCDRFCSAAAKAVQARDPSVMLTSGIGAAYATAVEGVAARNGVELLSEGCSAPNRATARLMRVGAARFMSDRILHTEMFGPAALVVSCADIEEMRAVLETLEGQLTIAMHFDEGDHTHVAELLPVAQRRAGRILANGFGTGVEVSPAMVHGGPWPASSDSRTTSVGTLAIERFLRPVCLQDFPEALLPPALRDTNPWNLPRKKWA